MKNYDFLVFAATPEGDVSSAPVETIQLACMTEGAAKTAARKLARQNQAPIDLARSGPSPWNDRYIGTASPSYPHTDCKITVFERLD